MFLYSNAVLGSRVEREVSRDVRTLSVCMLEQYFEHVLKLIAPSVVNRTCCILHTAYDVELYVIAVE